MPHLCSTVELSLMAGLWVSHPENVPDTAVRWQEHRWDVSGKLPTEHGSGLVRFVPLSLTS